MIPRRYLTLILLVCELCRAYIPANRRRISSLRRIRPALTPSVGCSAADATSFDSDESIEHSLQRVSLKFQNLPIGKIQRTLVQEGIQFQKLDEQQQADDEHQISSRFNDRLLTSSLQRVPACISNLHIQTILLPDDDDDVTNSNSSSLYRLSIRGTSDSLLSRGLLAVIATALQNQRADDVLKLSAESLADQLHLRRALSRGRNDGLAGIVKTVQDQIRQLILDTATAKITEPLQSTTAAVDIDELPLTKRAPTAALLLSGGVDSSVALHLLKRQGYSVTAFYLKIWLEDELAHLASQCPFEEDILMCQAVCDQAGVPLEQVSLQQEYQDRVISYTLQEARQGRTPNPDIMCNSRIKFGCFYDAIASRGFDHVATGHYAQLVRDAASANQMRLLRAPDPVKDQSYFLCALSQEQLQRVLFPIGHLQKSEVRALAEEFQLPNRNRPDSQGLCFLGKVKFDEFIKSYLGDKPGDIIDAATGEMLGHHRGVWYHTIGQRKGIGKSLFPLATSRGPWYVVAKDPEHNVVYCSNEYDESMFHAARSKFAVEGIQWFRGTAPASSLNGSCRLTMKIRHGPKLVEGILIQDKDETTGTIQLDQKDGGLAPGQFVVFYHDKECLGSGIISERHWAQFLLDQRVGGMHPPSRAIDRSSSDSVAANNTVLLSTRYR